MIKKGKILLLDAVHPDFQGMLEHQGFSVDLATVESEEQLQKTVGGYVGIIVRSAPMITRKVIDKADLLRFIARAGSGIENIDYAYAKSRGIEVLHSPEGNRDAVGEHALALVICLLKKIVSSSIEAKNGLWHREANRGNELMGRTVGIIGYGNTGSAFAQKLSGMGVRILAFDKYRKGFGNEFVVETTLSDVMQNADIISFHVPLTDETVHYAGREFFQNCANNIMLINTSRGKVVDTIALTDAMKAGKVYAAGLDVVEWERFDFDIADFSEQESVKYLVESQSVIITPHIAGITYEARKKHADVLCKKIADIF